MTATREPSVHGSELVRLVGADTEVPLVTGGTRRYVNLDYAASAPALQAVHDAVEELLGWYSSVHRGAGFKSRASTAAYEGARESIRRFVNARDDDAVIITRNTTDSINLLAGTLPEGTHVVAFAGEHHANLLPWKRIGVRYLPVPETPAEMLEQLETTLRDLPHCEDPHLVAATGASNVTGEIWPVAEIARVAHQYGARLLVDAAQLAPHAPIDMQRDGIDYLALSGHKLYAPYGAGALIGERDWLSAGDPFLRGGGAVKLVTVEETLWAELPDRQEAGSPNVIGAVALGVACDTLTTAGMARIAAEESTLLDYARERLAGDRGLRALPGLARRASTRRAADLQPARRPVRPARGGPLGRARHRHPSRVLLRPPAHDAAAPGERRRGRSAACRDARRPSRAASRRGAHEPRPGLHEGRRRHLRRCAARDRGRRAALDLRGRRRDRRVRA